MPFTGNESSAITLQQATDWTTTYRTQNSGAVKAHFFGKNKLMDLLDQPNCVGIRAYYAIDDNGAKQLVLVGATADEQDLYTGLILDHSSPCPTFCATASPLNG